MAAFKNGFFTSLGAVGATGSETILRPTAIEPLLWSVHGGTFGPEVLTNLHTNERVWTPNQSYRTFNTPSQYAMFGFEGRALPVGVAGVNTALKFGFSGAAHIASLRIASDGNMSWWLTDSTQIGISTTTPVSTFTRFYTIEAAFASTNPISCEVRVDGVRVPELTTTDFTAAGGQAAGTMTRAVYAAVTPITHVFVNMNNNASPVLYYWWQKNHSAIWHPVVTGAGSTFAEQSDFHGIKKKFCLTPNGAGNYAMVNWANGAGTYPTNIADTASGMDSDAGYIRNQNDGVAGDVADNKVSHGFTNLPAAATKVAILQRNCWARVDQSANAILARAGIRSGAGDTPASTDSFYTPTNSTPYTGAPTTSVSFSSTYSTGGTGFGTSMYLAEQPFSTGGTTVWSVTTVNAIEGIFQSVDIL